MEERQGYEVLKIVSHSGRCYMSTDYIRGKPLILWLRYHPQIGKLQFYQWIRGLLEDLENFHQCRGNPCYQYVNPYSIIVGEDGKLYLLDIGSSKQEDMLHLMQRRSIRENFLSPENQYYQKTSVKEDIYGLAKTIQYMLSVAEPEPSLGKLEEMKLQKLISKCLNPNSKNSYHTVREISEHFPGTKKTDGRRKVFTKKGFLCVSVFAVIAVFGMGAAGRNFTKPEGEKEEAVVSDLPDTDDSNAQDIEDYRKEMQEKQDEWNAREQEIIQSCAEREQELVYELALVYFIDLGQYGKAEEFLEGIEEPEEFAEDFAELCRYMDGQTASASSLDVEELLESLESETPDAGDDRYAYCISLGRQKLEEEKAKQDQALQNGNSPEIGEEAGNEQAPEAGEEAGNKQMPETGEEAGNEQAPEVQMQE